MSEKQPKAKRLSLKQTKFVDAYVENGGNATQAALVAYDTTNRAQAATIGRENLDRPYVKAVIDAKVQDLKNSTLDKVKGNDLIGLALDGAQSDMMDYDPKVRAEARKYILEIAKFLGSMDTGKVTNVDNRKVILPTWRDPKGNNK